MKTDGPLCCLLKLFPGFPSERRRRSRQAEYRSGGIPDERADGTEIRAVRDSLESALDVLEPRQKQIVILKYFEDLTIHEIAAAMQYPDGTIKTWLYKALRKLKDYMRKDGEPD
ncbi:RNA polymerase sigma factor [Paenibacillus sp. GCM10012303]|uniref:RNA polymerase sigma factor n=1 Tax=Paenibacillus sp. GCM10012303 TaxID=3317340 RepID=UPI00361C05FE